MRRRRGFCIRYSHTQSNKISPGAKEVAQEGISKVDSKPGCEPSEPPDQVRPANLYIEDLQQMYQSPPTMHSEAMKLETLIDISRNSLIYLIVALSIILIGVDFTFNTSCIWQLKYALYNVISKVFCCFFQMVPIGFRVVLSSVSLAPTLAETNLKDIYF